MKLMNWVQSRVDPPNIEIPPKQSLIGSIISIFNGRRVERTTSFAPSRISAGNLSRPSISDLRSSTTSLIRFIVSPEARHEYFLARTARKLNNALIQFDRRCPKNILYEGKYRRTISGNFATAKDSRLARISDALAAERQAENEAGKAGRKKSYGSLESSLQAYFDWKCAPKSIDYIRELADRLTKQEPQTAPSVRVLEIRGGIH